MSRTVVFPRGPSPLPRPAALEVRYAYRPPPGPGSRVFLLRPRRSPEPETLSVRDRDEGADLLRLPFLRCDLECGAPLGPVLLAITDEALLPRVLRGAASEDAPGRRTARYGLVEVTEEEAVAVSRASNTPVLLIHGVDPEAEGGVLRAAYRHFEG